MNQILSIGNNYNDNKIDTKKIIVFFCLTVIIVATAIILLKIYSIYKNKQNRSIFATPEIQIIEQEGEQVAINAYCEDGIDYIVYKWNDTSENRVNLDGSTTFKRILDIPYNKENILKIEVVSLNKVGVEAVKTFSMEIDETKPTIDSLAVVGSKLNIDTSDDSGIDYIEYQWEDEEPNKIIADSDNNKSVNLQINIERGTHKLTVKVLDIHGNEEKLSRLITGVNEPEIDVIRYDGVISVKATHDMGIKQISALINNKLYTFNEDNPDYIRDTTLQTEFPLEEGENVVKIIVHSYEKLSDDDDDSLNNYAFRTFVGTCTYNS